MQGKLWKTLTRFLVRFAGILAAVYLLAVGYLYAGQESLIFAGDRLSADHQFRADLPFQELTIQTDGAELNALHFKQPNPRGLVFFLRGNGGNLQSWISNVDYYRRVNYDMYLWTELSVSGSNTGLSIHHFPRGTEQVIAELVATIEKVTREAPQADY